MTSSLASLHADAIAMAGANHMWTNAYGGPIEGTSRPRSDAFPGLVAFLAAAQSGLCAACGEALVGEALDVCHIVASDAKGRGYVAGNLYLGHKASCNLAGDRDTYGKVVPLWSLVRADLVATTYPTRADMLALADAATATARRLAAREARRPA